MILRTVLLEFFFLIACFTVNAQELSLQFNAGLMNYGGDLQSKPYTFNEAEATAGINILYRVHKFSLRAGFNYGSVQGDDKKIEKTLVRNLNFKSKITEGNLCLQYDFLSADKDYKVIPYIFAGIGVYHYNPYTYYNNQKVYLQPLGTEGEGLSIYPNRKIYSLTSIENPLGIGVKYKLSSNFLLGVEFNTRILHADYLDDVSRSYPQESELFKAHGQLAVDVSFRGDELNPSLPFPDDRKRGNPHHNDNYYTSVITLTYIFSGHSLFEGSSLRHNKHSLDCPKKVQ